MKGNVAIVFAAIERKSKREYITERPEDWYHLDTIKCNEEGNVSHASSFIKRV